MYAIIAECGRQFKVEEGQELDLDLRPETEGEITLGRVLAVSNGATLTIGRATVEGASVTAEVIGVIKGPKLEVQKLRRRKNSRRRTGHRQSYTRVRISKITA